MAKTTKMKLLELMVLKEDVSAVIEYIGKRESFQFQSKENQKKKFWLTIKKEKNTIVKRIICK